MVGQMMSGEVDGKVLVSGAVRHEFELLDTQGLVLRMLEKGRKLASVKLEFLFAANGRRPVEPVPSHRSVDPVESVLSYTSVPLRHCGKVLIFVRMGRDGRAPIGILDEGRLPELEALQKTAVAGVGSNIVECACDRLERSAKPAQPACSVEDCWDWVPGSATNK